MAYVTNVWLLIALRFITAACAGTTAAAQTLLVKNTPENKQGFSLGMLTTAYWSGTMLGNVLGGIFVSRFGYAGTFWFCGILYFIGGFAVIFTRDGAINAAGHIKSAAAKRQWNIRSLIPALTVGAWIMSILFLLMGTIRNFEVPYVALHIETLTDPQEAALWTGIASAVFCGAAIIAGVFSGYIADKIPPLKILIPIMLISSASLLVQGFANDLWVFIISRSVLYTAAGGLQPVLQKVLTTITPQRKRGTVFGFASAGSSIGNMLSAVLGGAAYSLTSASGVFIITGVLYFLSMPAMIKGVLTAGKPFVFKRKTTLFGNSNRQTAKV
jgi:MFS family permease